MKTFKEFAESVQPVHDPKIVKHMEDGGYKVNSIKSKTNWGNTITHVQIGGLPTNKHGIVSSEDANKARKHFDKLGLKNHQLQIAQPVDTKVGGEFK